MLIDALTVLKDSVNDYLNLSSGQRPADSDLGQVVFTESEKIDFVEFKLGTITLLLINVEREHALRPADPYRRMQADGSTLRSSPPICLNLLVLFAARFKDYKQSLRLLSQILQFFVNRPVLDHENTPALSDRIEKLSVDLLTLPLMDQNDLWSVLRSAYLPSLLFKVRMISLQDEEGVLEPVLAEPRVEVRP